MEDVVSYEGKHNEANGEENRDGASDNLSSNYGVEGPTDDPVVRAYRERVKRSMLATVMASMGTPMILMGDECGHSQSGNNNAYCQDNELSWFDWSLPKSEFGQRQLDFLNRVADLRKRFATLRADHYLGDGELAPGVAELSWWDDRGVQLAPEDWDNGEGRALVLRRAARTADGTGGSHCSFAERWRGTHHVPDPRRNRMGGSVRHIGRQYPTSQAGRKHL